MDATDERAKWSIKRAWSGTGHTTLIADFHDGGWFQLATRAPLQVYTKGDVFNTFLPGQDTIEVDVHCGQRTRATEVRRFSFRFWASVQVMGSTDLTHCLSVSLPQAPHVVDFTRKSRDHFVAVIHLAYDQRHLPRDATEAWFNSAPTGTLFVPKLTITVIPEGHTSGVTFYTEGPPFHVNGARPPRLPEEDDDDDDIVSDDSFVLATQPGDESENQDFCETQPLPAAVAVAAIESARQEIETERTKLAEERREFELLRTDLEAQLEEERNARRVLMLKIISMMGSFRNEIAELDKNTPPSVLGKRKLDERQQPFPSTRPPAKINISRSPFEVLDMSIDHHTILHADITHEALKGFHKATKAIRSDDRHASVRIDQAERARVWMVEQVGPYLMGVRMRLIDASGQRPEEQKRVIQQSICVIENAIKIV